MYHGFHERRVVRVDQDGVLIDFERRRLSRHNLNMSQVTFMSRLIGVSYVEVSRRTWKQYMGNERRSDVEIWSPKFSGSTSA
jgi:predicted Ser/Thr protein kinase